MAVPCPGPYCGRDCVNSTLEEVCSFSECGSCSAGYYSSPSPTSICTVCTNEASIYDWLFFVTILFTPIVAQCIFYLVVRGKKSESESDKSSPILTVKSLTICGVSTLLQLGSFLLAVAIFTGMDNFGKFKVCETTRLRDWYPLFYNPSFDFETTWTCAYEVVYPRYTFPLTYLALSAGVNLIFCTAISFVYYPLACYAVLYLMPCLLFLYACLAGFIYYIFPYLLLACGQIGLVVLLSSWQKDCPGYFSLIFSLVKLPTRAAIIGAIWLLQAMALFACNSTNLLMGCYLLPALPALLLYYGLSEPFTKQLADNYTFSFSPYLSGTSTMRPVAGRGRGRESQLEELSEWQGGGANRG